MFNPDIKIVDGPARDQLVREFLRNNSISVFYTDKGIVRLNIFFLLIPTEDDEPEAYHFLFAGDSAIGEPYGGTYTCRPNMKPEGMCMKNPVGNPIEFLNRLFH